jgi:hypothetical protein
MNCFIPSSTDFTYIKLVYCNKTVGTCRHNRGFLMILFCHTQLHQKYIIICRMFSSAHFTLHTSHFIPLFLQRWNRQSVPKRWHLYYRRRRITQKKVYDVMIGKTKAYLEILLTILQSFDWVAAFHLDLLQAILFIAI